MSQKVLAEPKVRRLREGSYVTVVATGRLSVYFKGQEVD